MYVGLGLTGSGVMADSTGLDSSPAAVGGCDAPYVLSSQLGLCVDPSSCGSGWTFNAATGVCVQGTGPLAWLSTGNNGVYAALGVVAALFLFRMMKR